jgi:multidrug resistance efflux pump
VSRLSASAACLALALGIGLAVSGCGGVGEPEVRLLTSPEVGDFTLSVTGTGWVAPLEQHLISCPQGFYGIAIKEFAAEGTLVTTGTPVLTFDMGRYKDRLERRRRQHRSKLIQVERLDAKQAQERASSESQVTEKHLSLANAREKLGLLLAGPREEKIRSQSLMVEAGRAFEVDQERKLAQERKLRDRGFTSEISYLDTQGALEKARRRREAAVAELARLRGGPRSEDRRRLGAEKDLMGFETSQVEGKHKSTLEVQELTRREKSLEVKASDSRLKREEKRLGMGEVRSPATGWIIHSLNGELGNPVSVGAMVWSMQEVLRVVRLGQFKIKGRVSERDVDHVKVGSRVRLLFPALPGKELSGKVTQVGKFAVPEIPGENDGVKVFEVEVLLEGDQTELRPNLTAHMRISRETPKGPLYRVVPEAVLRARDKDQVVTEAGETVAVEIVAEGGDYLYIQGEPPARSLRLQTSGVGGNS